uniref:(northern house mosquito) hypothetical protein n=1 Tax=Culex pipiens TaxID=7175 RepID=A0A8D8CEI1_CULPI
MSKEVDFLKRLWNLFEFENLRRASDDIFLWKLQFFKCKSSYGIKRNIIMANSRHRSACRREYPQRFALLNVEFNDVTFGRFFLILEIWKWSQNVYRKKIIRDFFNNLKEIAFFEGIFFEVVPLA